MLIWGRGGMVGLTGIRYTVLIKMVKNATVTAARKRRNLVFLA